MRTANAQFHFPNNVDVYVRAAENGPFCYITMFLDDGNHPFASMSSAKLFDGHQITVQIEQKTLHTF